MWTEDESPSTRKYYQVARRRHQPKGVQSPHIPMLIAGAARRSP